MATHRDALLLLPAPQQGCYPLRGPPQPPPVSSMLDSQTSPPGEKKQTLMSRTATTCPIGLVGLVQCTPATGSCTVNGTTQNNTCVGFHGVQGMMPLTATHFQGEAMAATTKYRERLHHLKTHVLRSCNQCPAFISLLIDTEATYSPWTYSTPPLVKLQLPKMLFWTYVTLRNSGEHHPYNIHVHKC